MVLVLVEDMMIDDLMAAPSCSCRCCCLSGLIGNILGCKELMLLSLLLFLMVVVKIMVRLCFYFLLFLNLFLFQAVPWLVLSPLALV